MFYKRGTVIKAKDLPDWAGYFRKQRGTYVYLRISNASVKHLRLDKDKIHGVCFNGNVTSIDPEKFIVVCDVLDMARNVQEVQ